MNKLNTLILISILGGGMFEHTLDLNKRVYSPYGISPTIRVSLADDFDKAIKIKVLINERTIQTNTME